MAMVVLTDGDTIIGPFKKEADAYAYRDHILRAPHLRVQLTLEPFDSVLEIARERAEKTKREG